MLTLSKGFEKPQNPDTGDVWFPAMERNIQKLNDHNHNGVNSQSLGVTTQLINTWTPNAGAGLGWYKLVTIPAGFSFDTSLFWFKLSTGEHIYPTIVRISAGTFNLFMNTDTLQVVIYYR